MGSDSRRIIEHEKGEWLLWWNRYLVGVYEREDAAQEDLQVVTRAVQTVHGGRFDGFHVSRTPVAVASHRLNRARLTLLRDRAVADLIEEFGLVEAADRRGGPGTVEPLLVQLGRDRGHPGFQFDSDGTLLPGLPVALSRMRDAGWDDLSIALWFGSPQSSANGRVPAAVIRHDPVLVINAAHSSAAG